MSKRSVFIKTVKEDFKTFLHGYEDYEEFSYPLGKGFALEVSYDNDGAYITGNIEAVNIDTEECEESESVEWPTNKDSLPDAFLEVMNYILDCCTDWKN